MRRALLISLLVLTLSLSASALEAPTLSLNQPGCVLVTYCEDSPASRTAAEILWGDLKESGSFKGGGLGILRHEVGSANLEEALMFEGSGHEKVEDEDYDGRVTVVEFWSPKCKGMATICKEVNGYNIVSLPASPEGEKQYFFQDVKPDGKSLGPFFSGAGFYTRCRPDKKGREIILVAGNSEEALKKVGWEFMDKAMADPGASHYEAKVKYHLTEEKHTSLAIGFSEDSENFALSSAFGEFDGTDLKRIEVLEGGEDTLVKDLADILIINDYDDDSGGDLGEALTSIGEGKLIYFSPAMIPISALDQSDKKYASTLAFQVFASMNGKDAFFPSKIQRANVRTCVEKEDKEGEYEFKTLEDEKEGAYKVPLVWEGDKKHMKIDVWGIGCDLKTGKGTTCNNKRFDLLFKKLKGYYGVKLPICEDLKECEVECDGEKHCACAVPIDDGELKTVEGREFLPGGAIAEKETEETKEAEEKLNRGDGVPGKAPKLHATIGTESRKPFIMYSRDTTTISDATFEISPFAVLIDEEGGAKVVRPKTAVQYGKRSVTVKSKGKAEFSVESGGLLMIRGAGEDKGKYRACVLKIESGEAGEEETPPEEKLKGRDGAEKAIDAVEKKRASVAGIVTESDDRGALKAFIEGGQLFDKAKEMNAKALASKKPNWDPVIKKAREAEAKFEEAGEKAKRAMGVAPREKAEAVRAIRGAARRTAESRGGAMTGDARSLFDSAGRLMRESEDAWRRGDYRGAAEKAREADRMLARAEEAHLASQRNDARQRALSEGTGNTYNRLRERADSSLRELEKNRGSELMSEDEDSAAERYEKGRQKMEAAEVLHENGEDEEAIEELVEAQNELEAAEAALESDMDEELAGMGITPEDQLEAETREALEAKEDADRESEDMPYDPAIGHSAGAGMSALREGGEEDDTEAARERMKEAKAHFEDAESEALTQKAQEEIARAMEAEQAISVNRAYPNNNGAKQKEEIRKEAAMSTSS